MAGVALTALLSASPASAQMPRTPAPVPTTLPTTSETVTFGDGRGLSVTVVRGALPLLTTPPGTTPQAVGPRIETVRFNNPGQAPVTVIRGAATRDVFDLFRSAAVGELDRVAFAVEGVESGHGMNQRMWRPELDGPQGPMQVSAAAALGLGGGDRFDVATNRALGRAFLAEMYQRYGNWPDALAAYDWGPGHVDAWIAAGRPENKLPIETQRYIEIVLKDAVVGRLRL